MASCALPTGSLKIALGWFTLVVVRHWRWYDRWLNGLLVTLIKVTLMTKQAGKRKAQVNPHIQDELTAHTTESQQAAIFAFGFACFIITMLGFFTGFWGLLLHGWFAEDNTPMPGAIGIMVFFSLLIGVWLYWLLHELKVIRRGSAVVQNSIPHDVLLIIESSSNERGSYWFIRIVDEQHGESFMVRTMSTVENRTARRIDETYGLMYRTPNRHDPIVIQTIGGAIVCVYKGPVDEHSLREDEE